LNFLAHALLAGDDPALIVGGVVGDWIKGRLPAGLPDDLAHGVALHRAIDSHAETHAAFKQSRARISVERRRYAGVLVDVFYDHLLAKHWQTRHTQPLAQFCAEVYGHIEHRWQDLPPESHPALRVMMRENWLQSYVELQGIAQILARMSLRVRQPDQLLAGEHEFIRHAEGLKADFDHWLADAESFCAQWRAARQN